MCVYAEDENSDITGRKNKVDKKETTAPSEDALATSAWTSGKKKPIFQHLHKPTCKKLHK